MQGFTDDIDHESTIRLAECAKQAGVSRFLFASSCAVYGRGGPHLFNELDAANPMTPFADSKLRCEQDLARLADRDFTPVFLRNAEVYGVSPRLRTDLTVIDLVGSAVTQGRVAMRAGAGAWRPLVHIEDLCRAYALVLTAEDDVVRNETFNVVAPDENYRIIDIADTITDVLPRCTRMANVDMFARQSFRADGSKLRQTFPKLKFRWTLPLGLRQLRTAMLSTGMTPGDWRSDRYRRASHLQRLIEIGELDASLRRAQPAAA
jgi:nucleoside-diphosphate-sugar epimerase